MPRALQIGSPGVSLLPSIHSAITTWSDQSLKDVLYIVSNHHNHASMMDSDPSGDKFFSSLSPHVDHSKLNGQGVYDMSFLAKEKQSSGLDTLLLSGQAISRCNHFSLPDIARMALDYGFREDRVVFLSDTIVPSMDSQEGEIERKVPVDEMKDVADGFSLSSARSNAHDHAEEVAYPTNWLEINTTDYRF